MSALQEAQRLLAEMTSEEKAQLLRSIARELGDETSGIERAPDICGGAARIVRTRIPVWVLEQARRLGTSEAELLRAYPALHAEDLAHAWAYAAAHAEEIDRDIRENEGA